MRNYLLQKDGKTKKKLSLRAIRTLVKVARRTGMTAPKVLSEFKPAVPVHTVYRELYEHELMEFELKDASSGRSG